MNVLSIIGNLTKDPELKYSSEGKPYTKFTVAVPRRFNRSETDFFYCTSLGKQAENVAEYCRKGSKVGVSGQVNIDRKDDKTYINVLADSVDFLTPKGNQSNNGSDQRDPFENEGQTSTYNPNDLPF